jgi:hypothetical protein
MRFKDKLLNKKHNLCDTDYTELFSVWKNDSLSLKYLVLFVTISIITIFSHNAYAVNSIDWTYNETPVGSIFPPFPQFPQSSGNIVNDFHVSVLVDATDDGDFTTNGVIDTIDVVVSSADDPNMTTYTLTETGANDGIFTGVNFVFLNGDYKFQTTDIVDLIYAVENSSGCDTDNTITQLDSRSGGPDNGVIVHSDTDLGGVGLILTETGKNTCTFEGQLKFTTTDTTDEITGTLQVSQGDILTFEDRLSSTMYNAQIIPSVNGKGSIIANFDLLNDDNTAEVTVAYNGLEAGLDLVDDGSGTGGGALVRPGLVLNIVAFLSGGSNRSVPPTLGLDQNQKRIVEEGFSFNGNSVNVEQFYTPYPLITTEVGKLNTIKLKIYEDKGPDNIAHVGLSYGLGKGEIFNEGRATIEYDKTFDGKESITLFDPKHVLGKINVTRVDVKCSDKGSSMCSEVTFDHIFREPLEYNMVATNIWNYQRNGWQNYFNHGIEIVGESMNPPEEYLGIYKGNTYHLTETGKNTAIDNDGNSWTFDRIWNHDYIKPVNIDNDILNPEKIRAIEKLGFQYSDGEKIFGFERIDHRFEDVKKEQQILAQNIMKNICPECLKEHYEKINDIFAYDLPDRYQKLDDPEIIRKMSIEDQKAQRFLKEYFEKIYLTHLKTDHFVNN